MKTVEMKIAAGVAWLTLNRPDAANAINMALADDLFEALTDANANDAVRTIVLNAGGKLFCGGGDLAEFGVDAEESRLRVSALATSLHRSIALIEEMQKPLITSVQGTAAGAGVVLAAAGDIALAADHAKFVPAYGSIGLTPDGGTTWYLPRLMGERQAMEMLLTGRTLTASEAAAAGLITRVVGGDSLEEETAALAATLAEAPAWAMGQTRRLVRAGRAADLRAHLEDEAETIGNAATRPEARGAIASFLARS